jgi:hypothetical protein
LGADFIKQLALDIDDEYAAVVEASQLQDHLSADPDACSSDDHKAILRKFYEFLLGQQPAQDVGEDDEEHDA